jgi:hypothetical protein
MGLGMGCSFILLGEKTDPGGTVITASGTSQTGATPRVMPNASPPH